MKDARISFKRWMQSASLAAAVAWPAAAGADNHIRNVSPGLHLTWAFGAERFVGPGIDVVAFPFVGDWQAAGAFAQIDLYDLTIPRIAAGFAATAYAPGAAANLTAGYAFVGASDTAGSVHGTHLGLEGNAFYAGAMLYGTIPIDGDEDSAEIAISLVLRPIGFMRKYVSNVAIAGRPLRVDGGRVLPPVVAAGRARAEDRPDDARSRVAEKWLDDARNEFASVPAFLRLAAELGQVGAPRALVGAAFAAADDEVVHARMAFSLANRYAGVRYEPVGLPAQPRTDVLRPAALGRLAVESLLDGALGEGLAAAEAREAAASAEGDVAHALGRIAFDESRHADLGWAVLDWAMREGGRPTRDAVAEALEIPDVEPPRPSDDGEDLCTHGLLAASTRTDLAAAHARTSRAKALRLLDSAT